MQEKRIVYLDYAAATPMDPKIKTAMDPYFSDIYGNPSASYAIGRRAKEALDLARDTIAKTLGCTAAEIIFTGSGTESDNLAIFGVARQYRHPERSEGSPTNVGSGADPATAGRDSSPTAQNDKIFKGHIITTNIEHHAVLNPCEALGKDGYDITLLKVDRDGLISPEQLKEAIRPDTILISIMYANNEIGTIEPIAKLARAIAEKKIEMGRKPNDPPFFHTDACQAAGYLDINVKNIGVDLMTINGSKIYGPKGTGALFVRRGLRLTPLIYGGGQEMKLRSGTENVAGIVGLATALEEVTRLRDSECARLTILRDTLIQGIVEKIPNAVLNGHPTLRLPNNVNISIADIEGEVMLLYLDESGICASTGSACDFQTTDPSHVVQALGKSREIARSSIRFTLGRSTTIADIDYVLETLPPIVKKLHELSPDK